MPAHIITPPPPWATRSTTFTSANHSPTRRHTLRLPSALYSENRDSSVKRWTSPKCQTPSNVSLCPLKSVTTMNCSQVKTRWGRQACRWASLRHFLTVCAEIFGYVNRLLQQLSGWLVSDDLGGEDAGCGGPGLVWLHVVCGCEAGWMYCQILWNAFGDSLW